MASANMEEPQVDVRDDSGTWMGLLASVNLPVTTIEALRWGANITSIGTMQIPIRSEQDLDDFMHGMLFNVGGPLLSPTGTEGWEKDLPENNFGICK